jgi:hypothetical protein
MSIKRSVVSSFAPGTEGKPIHNFVTYPSQMCRVQGEPKKAKESSASSIPGKLYYSLFFSLFIDFLQ